MGVVLRESAQTLWWCAVGKRNDGFNLVASRPFKLKEENKAFKVEKYVHKSEDAKLACNTIVGSPCS